MKFPPLVFLTAISMISSVFAASLTEVDSLADTSVSPYTVSSTDLLEVSGSVSSSSGSFTSEDQEGISALTDGTFGLSGSPGQNPGSPSIGSATAGNFNSITFSLGSNPLGYNVTTINTYAGWDKSRYGQAFDLYVQHAGNPTFVLLQSVDYYPMFPGDTGLPTPSAGSISERGTKVSLTGFLGEVTGLRFDFFNPTPLPFPAADNYMGYREFDVFGAAVPEPSTFAMILLGAGILLSIRQRNPKPSR